MRTQRIVFILSCIPIMLGSSLSFAQSSSDRIKDEVANADKLFASCLKGEITPEVFEVKATAGILRLQTDGLYTPEKANSQLTIVKSWVKTCRDTRSYLVEAEAKKLALIKGEITEQEYRNFHIEHYKSWLKVGLINQQSYAAAMAQMDEQIKQYKEVQNTAHNSAQKILGSDQAAQLKAEDEAFKREDPEQYAQINAELEVNKAINQLQSLLQFCIAGTYTSDKYEQESIKIANDLYQKGYIDAATLSTAITNLQHDKQLCEAVKKNIQDVSAALEQYRKGEISVDTLRRQYAASLTKVRETYNLPSEYVTEALLELETAIKQIQQSK